MKTPFSFLACWAAALLPAAVHAASGPAAAATATLALSYHQRAALPGGGTLRFERFVDTRCPADVQCISAGDAQAFVRLSPAGGGKAELVALPWSGAGDGPAVVASGLRLQLLSMEPRPLAHGHVKPSRYRITLAVSPAP